MRILLVEDDRMIAEGVRKALRGEGFAVDWVEDGDAALSAASADSYDLMLLDLGLPRRDGIDVLRTLRARGAALPVLILTARDAVADRVKGSMPVPTTISSSPSISTNWAPACAR